VAAAPAGGTRYRCHRADPACAPSVLGVAVLVVVAGSPRIPDPTRRFRPAPAAYPGKDAPEERTPPRAVTGGRVERLRVVSDAGN
jgi:hypothetical protein